MLECWQEHPTDRPTFSQLRNKFSTLLLANVDDPYMVLEVDDAKAYYTVSEEETSEQRESASSNDSDSSLKKKKGPPKKPVWAKPSNPYVDTPALSKEMSIAVTVEEETRQETATEEVPTLAQQNGVGGEAGLAVPQSDTKSFDPYIRMQSSPAYITDDDQTGLPQSLQLECDDLNQQMVSMSLPAEHSMGMSLSAMSKEKVVHMPAKRTRSNPYIDDPARKQLLEEEESDGMESKMPIISETEMAEVTAREP